jgi:hypothetical protein
VWGIFAHTPRGSHRLQSADSRPSGPRPAMGRFEPKESFQYKETAYVR